MVSWRQADLEVLGAMLEQAAGERLAERVRELCRQSRRGRRIMRRSAVGRHASASPQASAALSPRDHVMEVVIAVFRRGAPWRVRTARGGWSLVKCKCCERRLDPREMATIEVKLEVQGRPLAATVCSGTCAAEWLSVLSGKIARAA